MEPTREKAAGTSVEVREQLVIRSDDDGVTTLTLNRPDKLNALTPAIFVALKHHLDQLEGCDTVRCVVLRGAGRAFCSGHDLGSIAKKERAPSKHYAPEVIDQLAALNIPTIAQVHGFCFTGGLELALACDLLVAASSAQFADTHSKWGLVPMWGMSVRLPERVGIAKAKEMMFTSRVIDSETALHLGLADRRVPDCDLHGTAAALAREIATTSAGTNGIVKRLLADRTTYSPYQRLERERTLFYGVPADTHERLRGGGQTDAALRD